MNIMIKHPMVRRARNTIFIAVDAYCQNRAQTVIASLSLPPTVSIAVELEGGSSRASGSTQGGGGGGEDMIKRWTKRLYL